MLMLCVLLYERCAKPEMERAWGLFELLNFVIGMFFKSFHSSENYFSLSCIFRWTKNIVFYALLKSRN